MGRARKMKPKEIKRIDYLKAFSNAKKKEDKRLKPGVFNVYENLNWISG